MFADIAQRRSSRSAKHCLKFAVPVVCPMAWQLC
jgi:hypothetical protein